MTRWKKTTTALCLALCLTLGLGAVPAMALGPLDPAHECTVTVDMAEKAYREDMEAYGEGAMMTVAVYKVADIDANGLLTLTKKFQGTALQEGWAPVWDSTRDVEELTEKIAAIVGDDAAPMEPDSTETIDAVKGQLTLTPGLYLLAPEDVLTEEWVYSFSPVLLSVPALGTADDAQNGREPTPSPDPEAAPGETPAPEDVDWQYEYTVFMKPQREFRLGHLRIEKNLKTYNQALGETTFLFLIEGRKGGELVYSRLESLTFSGAGLQSLELDDIPVNADVTVTELYSGASYQPDNDTVTVTIPEPVLKDGVEDGEVAAFTNDYTTRIIPDVSVVNRFVYNGTGWKWQSPDNSEEAEG